MDPVLRHLLPFEVQSLTATPPTLAELFLRHYGDELAQLGTADLTTTGGAA